MAIEWQPNVSVCVEERRSTITDPLCPRWRQGIATIDRLRSGGAEPNDPAAIRSALTTQSRAQALESRAYYMTHVQFVRFCIPR